MVLRMSKGAESLPARLPLCPADAKQGQFRGKAATPRSGSKEIADLNAPAGLERVFIETAKADRPPCLLVDDHPGRAVNAATLPLMCGQVAPAVPHGSLHHREAHGRGVAEEFKQRLGIRKTRRAER